MTEFAIELARDFCIAALDKTSRNGCLKSQLSGQTLTMPKTVPFHKQLKPNPNSPVWNQITDWDRRVWASQLSWTRESIHHPSEWSDEQKADFIARQVETESSYSQEGAPTAQESVLCALKEIQMHANGWTTHVELEVVFYRGARWAQRTQRDEEYGDSQTIEYLDGSKEAHFYSHKSADTPNSTDATDGSWSGGVSPWPVAEKEYKKIENPNGSWACRERPMSRTAPRGLDVLLMMAPVIQAFPPQSTRLEVRDDVIELTALKDEDSFSRLNLDRQSGRVLSLQGVSKYRGEVFLTQEVQSWRAVAGVEVPEVIISYWTREGSLEKYNHRHQLQSVRLNADVPADALAFPVGAQVEDWRLGAKRIVNYVLQSGELLSLAELKQQPRRNAPIKSRLLLGLVAVAVMAFLLRFGGDIINSRAKKN